MFTKYSCKKWTEAGGLLSYNNCRTIIYNYCNNSSSGLDEDFENNV